MSSTPEQYNQSQVVNLTALKALGWWPFSFTPSQASEHTSAIMLWQKAQGLGRDGKFGPGCWEKCRMLLSPYTLPIPKGYKAVEALYSELEFTEDAKGVHPSSQWKKDNLTTITLCDGKKVLFHSKIAKEFAFLYEKARSISGYEPKSVQTWVPRRKRGGKNFDAKSERGLSMHCWCAVDFDPSDNPWGNKASSPLIAHPLFNAVFRVAGWNIGADWKDPDTMHLQRATGV